MRLIDADKFKENLLKLWDYNTVDGITATTVLKQVISDLDNAPTIIKCGITSDGLPRDEKAKELRAEAELYREETCEHKDRCDDYKYWHCKGCNGCKKGGSE